MGHPSAARGGGPPDDVLAFVARGMDRELREVFALVRAALDEAAAGRDDGPDD